MKKFFERNDLLKLALIFVFIAVLLTWFVQFGYFQGGELVIGASNKLGFWHVSYPIGLFDIGTYGLLGLYYFPTIFVYIFICAGFYSLLGSTSAYQKLTTNIANSLKGKEIITIAVSTLIFACLSGIVNEHLALLVIIPFVISILSKMKVDKVTGVVATFGGVLIGILGSTYSPKIVGYLVNSLQLTYGYELIPMIVLFAVSYLLLIGFAVIRYEHVKNKDVDKLEDPFASAENKVTKSKKVKILPLTIVLVITFVIAVVAMISWTEVFNIELFDNVTNNVTEAKIKGVPIFGYLLSLVGQPNMGSALKAYGQWDLLTLSGFLLIATMVVKIITRSSFDKVIEKYGEGFKKVSKSVVLLLVIYVVLEFSVMFPVITTIVDKIMGIGNNIFTMFISGALTSIFTVDFQYTTSLLSGLFSTFTNVELSGLALQSSYGIMSFIAPTSAIMMLGLSLTNTKYPEWFKFIWKFVLAATVVSFIILAIVAHV